MPVRKSVLTMSRAGAMLARSGGRDFAAMRAAGETRRFAVASLALGAIGYFGSEAFFWSFPPVGLTLADWAMTVVAYGLVAACALAAVIWSGLGGWRAMFLGSAIAGWLLEGVVVDTMYDVFPFQLVWTPLAWHAVITGLAVIGLQWVAASGPLWRHLSLLALVGIGGAAFAGFWPTERPDLPPPPQIFVYQLGSGLAAVAGLALLRRLDALPRPPKWVLLVVPAMALLLWLGKSLADPRPTRLALPILLALSLWAMRRHGDRTPFRPMPVPLWRDGLFLIVPLIVALVASFAVLGTPGIETNIVAALTLVPAGLCLWLWLLWRAFRQPARGAPR